ncbi:hypothetical protein RM780_18830 [Streptomyces sp. DSM 44917]|uniref:Uncharacterized protein n=1 Tax=Streptomyces boetiae TaxID=3075541 RepID=A0ABU2LCL5_9ACTN|nr:hypothetical protein [Streptomyces sp. DSM 44917]MDT0308998.1 hypothetical protein [Streptomyces sp. DSM 44917]
MWVEDLTTTAREAEAVHALVVEGEASRSEGPGSAQGVALLLLAAAALLSANPRKEEPLEDAFEGMAQNLACAAAF